jgi:hypothetical protein
VAQKSGIKQKIRAAIPYPFFFEISKRDFRKMELCMIRIQTKSNLKSMEKVT